MMVETQVWETVERFFGKNLKEFCGLPFLGSKERNISKCFSGQKKILLRNFGSSHFLLQGSAYFPGLTNGTFVKGHSKYLLSLLQGFLRQLCSCELCGQCEADQPYIQFQEKGEVSNEP